MKYLTILLLFISGCCGSNKSDTLDSNIVYGTRVTVSGFYAGCYGYVTGLNDSSPHCLVELDCYNPATGEHSDYKSWMYRSEFSLK